MTPRTIIQIAPCAPGIHAQYVEGKTYAVQAWALWSDGQVEGLVWHEDLAYLQPVSRLAGFSGYGQESALTEVRVVDTVTVESEGML